MSAVVLWTGGKDSSFALYQAKLSGYEVLSLVTFVPREKEFPAHPVRFMKYQAKALGLPHYTLEINEPFKENYERAIYSLKQRYNISTLITGDIAEVNSHPNWIRECGRRFDVNVLAPLWGSDRLELLNRLLSCGFKAIFSCVKKPWFTEDWVGMELNKTSLERLRIMSAKTGMDMCGEQGEYHTLVVDGPLFEKSIHIIASSSLSSDFLMYIDIQKIGLREKYLGNSGFASTRA